MRTVFGEDVMLVHSSGVPVPTNEHGILIQNLHHGESYFLVLTTYILSQFLFQILSCHILILVRILFLKTLISKYFGSDNNIDYKIKLTRIYIYFNLNFGL